MALTDKLTAIANAIRSKTGTSEGLTLDGMATAINGIQTGGGNELLVKVLNCTGDIDLSDITELTSLRQYMFYYGQTLRSVIIPSSVTNVEYYVFYSCPQLASVTFRGKPNIIYNNAFYSCNNLKSIKVPWSEGEVANAPWGATRATITYNYTE